MGRLTECLEPASQETLVYGTFFKASRVGPEKNRIPGSQYTVFSILLYRERIIMSGRDTRYWPHKNTGNSQWVYKHLHAKTPEQIAPPSNHHHTHRTIAETVFSPRFLRGKGMPVTDTRYRLMGTPGNSRRMFGYLRAETAAFFFIASNFLRRTLCYH
jgi:hypothetical protein